MIDSPLNHPYIVKKRCNMEHKEKQSLLKQLPYHPVMFLFFEH